MRQTARIISTYSADVFGVCSALFELGGMVVIHDASGCNSTYTTHDEPRWFDMDSMVYISALSEMEAIMGDDEKLLGDIVAAAGELEPAFIAIAGTPIPMMTGFDYEAAAAVLEARTGIPSFGFATTGMNDYTVGISMALSAFARRFARRDAVRSRDFSCNILGLTPLDFSMNGSADSLKEVLRENGCRVISSWAMGAALEDLKNAGEARVNLVASSSGTAAAEVLKELFGTPWVAGLPIGAGESRRLLRELRSAAAGETRELRSAAAGEMRPGRPGGCSGDFHDRKLVIIGEAVLSVSLAHCVEAECGILARVICPTVCPEGLLRAGDVKIGGEDGIIHALLGAEILIADPLYRPLCPEKCRFVSLPHEAFSGRMFSRENPNLITDYNTILNEVKRYA